MGKIKKILENELIGGTQSTDVYPVTSVKAVYNENNERLDNILGNLDDKIDDIKQGIIFDVSAHNNSAVFESLKALLSSSDLNTLIPISVRHGGMSIRFIQGSVSSSDSKYVQYRLMTNTFSTNEADWQGVDDEPIVGSDNLVKSGGVANKLAELLGKSETIKSVSFEINWKLTALANKDECPDYPYVYFKLPFSYVTNAFMVYQGATDTSADIGLSLEFLDTEKTLCRVRYNEDEANIGKTYLCATTHQAPCVIEIYHEIKGKIERIEDDVLPKTVVCWGDSLTAGAGGNGITYPNELQKLLGYTYSVINAGVGGENTLTIMGRQGAMPMVIANEFILPADGQYVNIDITNYEGTSLSPLLQGGESTINPCYLDGVECQLALRESGVPTYKIKRTNVSPSDRRIIKGVPVITSFMRMQRKPGILIVWMGTNGGFDGDSSKLIEQYKKVLAYSNTDKYLFIGFHQTHNSTKEILEQFEKDLSVAFGANFLNWRKMCISHGLEDAGITPTHADEEAINNGKIPPSLLSDSVHLTPDGYKVVAKYVYQRLTELGYIII